MLKKRIIPTLLISDEKLVKTKKFKNASYVGDPINVVKIFNEKEVDELIILDIKSSITKNINFELIEKIAGECRMPFAYGGGINCIEHAEKLFSIGVEKIVLNNSAIKNPSFINDLSTKFGSQSVVISLNIKKDLFGRYKIYDWINDTSHSPQIKNFINDIIKRGAGELLISYVDNDGLLNGFDCNLYNKLDIEPPIPIVINGGINSIENIKEIFTKTNIDAVSIGSFFIYYGPHKAVLISYINKEEKNYIHG